MTSRRSARYYFDAGLMPPCIAPDHVWDEWFQLRRESGQFSLVHDLVHGVEGEAEATSPAHASAPVSDDDEGVALTVQPLRSVESILLPDGAPFVVQTDHWHARRALVAVCEQNRWAVHHRSKELVRCVSAEGAVPYEVVRQGSELMAVWVGVA